MGVIIEEEDEDEEEDEAEDIEEDEDEVVHFNITVRCVASFFHLSIGIAE